LKRIALIAILTATLAGALGNASAHAARPQPYPQFPFSQQAAFNVQWYGGPVMPYAENVLVLWGTNTNVPASSILNSLLTDMRDAGPADPYNIALQYGTQGRTPVGAGSPAVGQPLTNSQDYSGSPITISRASARARPPARSATCRSRQS